MKTITLKIKESDISKFGLENIDSLYFNDLVSKIGNELTLQALKAAQKAAKSAGLSKLTEDEINSEINEIRNESSS
ncbi:hypothetical protein [Algoriphagus algorifonticola]|uniref:hypothetical protein n=1 Tax=Algoriphagus algorifonticola TaxID=2593007 RepID=UPI0011A12A47|nr:hypothetical protein [Algoriphagus algorifonticola]